MIAEFVLTRNQLPTGARVTETDHLPRYSTSWGAVGELLDELAAAGWQCGIEYCRVLDWPRESEVAPSDQRWRASICAVPGSDMCWSFARGATGPEAVARAFLLAKEATND